MYASTYIAIKLSTLSQEPSLPRWLNQHYAFQIQRYCTRYIMLTNHCIIRNLPMLRGRLDKLG